MRKWILLLLVLLGSASVLADSSFVGEEKGYGKGVIVTDNRVEINKSFLKALAAMPSLQAYDGHIWELQYLIGVGNRTALSVGIELISLAEPKQVKIDDDHGVRILAASVSHHPDFWTMLRTKPLQLRRKVVRYYDINRCDYFGHDYEDEKVRTLK